VHIFYAISRVNVLHGGVLASSLRAGDSSGSALDVALAELQLNPREVMCKISLFCMHNYRILWRREQVSCRKSYTLRFRLLTVLLTFNWCSSEDLWLEG